MSAPLDQLDARARLLRGLTGRDSEPAFVLPAMSPIALEASSDAMEGVDHGTGSAGALAASAVSDSLQAGAPRSGMEHFYRLQRRMLLATGIVSVLTVTLTALLGGRTLAFSVLVGALAGLLYLRLLARSVNRLGGQARSVEKTQLLVPIVLVLAASRLPQLEILPAFLGFLLYKPAVILQAVLDSPQDS